MNEKGVVAEGRGGVEEAYPTINAKCEGPNHWRGCNSREADGAWLRKRNIDVRAWVGSVQFSCFRWGMQKLLLALLHCIAKNKINASNIF